MFEADNIRFKSLVSKLELNTTGSLSLNGLPMVLMPRHFFRYILREVHKSVSPEVFRRIYWQAGYDGAISFCESFQKNNNCTPQEAVQGYLEEMSIRGWGHFSIRSLNPRQGTMEVVLEDSALLEEGDIPSGNLAWEGAMVGSMAFIQRELSEQFVPGTEVRGTEVVNPKTGKTDFHICVAPITAAKG